MYSKLCLQSKVAVFVLTGRKYCSPPGGEGRTHRSDEEASGRERESLHLERGEAQTGPTLAWKAAGGFGKYCLRK